MKKILISTVYECQWAFLSKIDRRCFVTVVVLVLMSKKDSYMNIPLKLQAFVKMKIISTHMLTEIKYLQWQFMKLYGFTRLWCSLW